MLKHIIFSVDFDFQVVEHGLGHLPFTEKQVVTPTGVLGIMNIKAFAHF